PELPERTRIGPPGVDVEAFTPLPRDQAAQAVRELAGRLRVAPPEPRQGSSFDRDTREVADALDRLDLRADRLVAYVGKLIVSKGVALLLAAWPLVLDRVPDARLVIV